MKLDDQSRTGVFPEHEGLDFIGATLAPCALTIPAREALLGAGATIARADPPLVAAPNGDWVPASGEFWAVQIGQRCPPALIVRERYGVRGFVLRRADEPEWPNEVDDAPFWAQLDLTPCPRCGSALVWYEAGFVPGYRVCAGPQHHHWLARPGDPKPAPRHAYGHDPDDGF